MIVKVTRMNEDLKVRVKNGEVMHDVIGFKICVK